MEEASSTELDSGSEVGMLSSAAQSSGRRETQQCKVAGERNEAVQNEAKPRHAIYGKHRKY